MKVWCNETNFPSIKIHVVVGKKRAQRAARGLGFNEDFSQIDGDAFTARVPGDETVLVTITNGVSKLSDTERLGVFAHEASHCVNAWLEVMGEDEPGEEEMAYMQQACFMSIYDGYNAEMKRKAK